MTKRIILISKTPIVIQIFKLICKKVNIDLKVLESFDIESKVDLIIADNDYISEELNHLKSLCSRVGVISNDEISFEIANDFVIPLPFLPSSLQQIIEEQIEIIIQNSINKKTYVTSVEPDEQESDVEMGIVDDIDEIIEDLDVSETQEDESQELNPALDYLETLAESIAEDMEDETDESVVSLASINNGGVLDVTELTKIRSLIDEKKDGQKKEASSQSIEENIENLLNENEDDSWQDLSHIIDQAISEINGAQQIEQTENSSIDIKLNDYNLQEIKPLLTLLNQELIDKLTMGEQITVNLQMDKDDE